MKKICFALALSLSAVSANSQTAQDLFRHDCPVTWLGIDFTHVRLIGTFAEFYEIGEKSPVHIITDYFPEWNWIVLKEREKYDIRGMLRRMDIDYDIDMIMDLNYQANPDSMEAYNTKRFTGEDIQAYVNQYDLKGKEGIGVLFMAECLNKSYEEAIFHFVAINMKTREVLFHERLRGKPGGIGLRNYWANSVYRIINDIKHYYYNNWKSDFKRAESQSV
ncbi:MAG: hypothetical protein JW973_10240 [Bacteroidales bacterium]|nr:hypothetical protein [Bacteroidales bacterium]